MEKLVKEVQLLLESNDKKLIEMGRRIEAIIKVYTPQVQFKKTIDRRTLNKGQVDIRKYYGAPQRKKKGVAAAKSVEAISKEGIEVVSSILSAEDYVSMARTEGFDVPRGSTMEEAFAIVTGKKEADEQKPKRRRRRKTDDGDSPDAEPVSSVPEL